MGQIKKKKKNKHIGANGSDARQRYPNKARARHQTIKLLTGDDNEAHGSPDYHYNERCLLLLELKFYYRQCKAAQTLVRRLSLF